MTLDKKEIISAQVIMYPASGKPLDRGIVITSENVEKFKPSSNAFSLAKSAFTTLGFEVGSMVGISFSITGSISTFENVFKVGLRRNTKGGIESVKKDGTASLELPLEQLSDYIRKVAHVVTFSEPPDFGPTEFSV